MGNSFAFLYPSVLSNMAENRRQFAEEKTIKLTGVSEFVKDQITLHYQEEKNRHCGDVDRVHVCPDGKDYVLVEFAEQKDKRYLSSSHVEIQGSLFTLEPYSIDQPKGKSDETVSKIWADDVAISTQNAGGISSSSDEHMEENRERTANRWSKKNSSKWKRSAQFDERRNINGANEESRTSTSDVFQEDPMFKETEVKLSDAILHSIVSEKSDTDKKKLFLEQNVKLNEETGYVSGSWNDIANLFNRLSYVFRLTPSSLTDQLNENDNSGDYIRVDPLLFRYILTYHYENFKELENVSSEIHLKYISPNERLLMAIPRENKDKSFQKSMDKFIDFYQEVYQTNYQEIIPVHQTSSADASIDVVMSETRDQYPVIVFINTDDPNEIIVYGKREKAKKAVRFIKEKLSGNPKMANKSGGSIPTEYWLCQVSQKVKLLVYQGDLTEEKVDAIVNPANDRLKHEGGAAGAISKKGGSIIQSESDQLTNQGKRRLKVGDVEVTSAGNLPCRHVVHAVGPDWDKFLNKKDVFPLLKKAVRGSLEVASAYEAQSISIPAISSGIYRVPIELCAEALFTAVEEFVSNAHNGSSLTEIRFVNNVLPTVKVFQKEMKKRYKSAVMISQSESPDNNPIDTVFNDNMSHQGTGNTDDKMNAGKTSSLQKNMSSRIKSQQTTATKDVEDIHTQKNKRDDQTFYQAGQSNGRRKTYSSVVANNSNSSDDTDKLLDDDTSECSICLDVMTNPKILDKCNHSFCTECIENAFKHQKKCPLCFQVYGVLTGDQPNGNMSTRTTALSLPGYDKCGTIVISYSFPNGTQGSNHPNPGKRYNGTLRTAYLPDNQEGQKVLKLLRKAFDQKLTFTIGRSVTTGVENNVIWNDIHHKTNERGGSTSYGYPDPSYLKRVQEELAAKGITE